MSASDSLLASPVAPAPAPAPALAPPASLRRLALGAAFMCCVCSIFAGYSVLAHVALGSSSNAHALAFAWVRDAIGATLLLSAAYLRHGGSGAAGAGAGGKASGASDGPAAAAPEPGAFWPAREDWPRLLACGLFGVWGAQGMSALALANLNATLFAVLEQLLPVVALAVCALLGEERFAARDALSWAKVLGVALAVGGAAFLAWCASGGGSGGGGGGGLTAGNGNLPVGLAFTAVQLALGGSYSVVQKPLLRRYPPVVVAAWGYVCGLGLLTLSVATGTTADAWRFTELNLLAVAYAGVLSSFVAYYLMAVANSLAGPLFLTAFFPVQPIATAVIAYAAFGQTLTLGELGGAAIVSAGLLCVVGAKALEGGREAAAAAAAAGKLVEVEMEGGAGAEEGLGAR